jgi:putative transposase
MADEEDKTAPNVTETVGAEQISPAAPKRPTRVKKTAVEKTITASPKPAKPKSRGLSSQEKLERINQIEAQVAAGATLKDAVGVAGISDQTYYQWKKVAFQPVAEVPNSTPSTDDEFAEFTELEEENRRLRKLLSEKLHAENAELRKRLGLN